MVTFFLLFNTLESQLILKCLLIQMIVKIQKQALIVVTRFIIHNKNNKNNNNNNNINDNRAFIDTNDCEDSKAGPDCSNQVIIIIIIIIMIIIIMII